LQKLENTRLQSEFYKAVDSSTTATSFCCVVLQRF